MGRTLEECKGCKHLNEDYYLGDWDDDEEDMEDRASLNADYTPHLCYFWDDRIGEIDEEGCRVPIPTNVNRDEPVPADPTPWVIPREWGVGTPEALPPRTAGGGFIPERGDDNGD